MTSLVDCQMQQITYYWLILLHLAIWLTHLQGGKQIHTKNTFKQINKYTMQKQKFQAHTNFPLEAKTVNLL